MRGNFEVKVSEIASVSCISIFLLYRFLTVLMRDGQFLGSSVKMIHLELCGRLQMFFP